jgi:uncharacterized heparinase superfamily protein
MLHQFADRARRMAVALRLARDTDLVIAPPDLRTADPPTASDMLAGRFVLGGKLATVPLGRSCFSVSPPSGDWLAELHGFSWLRHLRGANTAAARAVARSMLDEWLVLRPTPDIGWRTDVAARRLLSLLAHAPLFLEDADASFYVRLVQTIRNHHKRLRDAADGPPHWRLLAAIAYAECALCLDDGERPARKATDRLVRELAGQILNDGGHASRGPHLVPDLLADLLPLRQVYLTRTSEPPVELIRVIDRMLPLLRLFRHGDGAFALFNGGGPVPSDLVATLLAYDEAYGPAPAEAPDMGFHRMEAGRYIAIVDTGTAPLRPFASEAHAGALAFELSHGAQRLFVNCGMPSHGREPWRGVARATAAHCTLILDDTSSARIPSDGALQAGPKRITAKRAGEGGAVRLTLSHDGYAAAFKAVHHRTLAILPDEDAFEGIDEVYPADPRRPVTDVPFAIRFHLHPMVRATIIRDGTAALLLAPGRGAWEFSAQEGALFIEESVFLAATEGPRRTDQLVIAGRTGTTPKVHWRLIRRTG